MTKKKVSDQLPRGEVFKRLWETIEREYVEEGTRIEELRKKYQVSKPAIYKHAKRDDWKAKRENFIRLPRAQKLAAAEEHDRFFDWMRATVQSLGARYLKRLQEQAAERAKGTLDSMVQIAEDATAGLQLVRFAEACYGPRKELPPPEIDYDVIVTEREIGYRVRKPGQIQERIIVDIPPEDVTKYDPSQIIEGAVVHDQVEGEEHVEE